MCDTFRNESAVPDEATSDSVRAVVQPDPSNTSPTVFHRSSYLNVQYADHNYIDFLAIEIWPFPVYELGEREQAGQT